MRPADRPGGRRLRDDDPRGQRARPAASSSAPDEVFWLEDGVYVNRRSQRVGFRAAVLADLAVHHTGGPYYTQPLKEKDEWWARYWARPPSPRGRQARRSSRVPLVRRLNTRFGWFVAPAPDSAPGRQLPHAQPERSRRPPAPRPSRGRARRAGRGPDRTVAVVRTGDSRRPRAPAPTAGARRATRTRRAGQRDAQLRGAAAAAARRAADRARRQPCGRERGRAGEPGAAGHLRRGCPGGGTGAELVRAGVRARRRGGSRRGRSPGRRPGRRRRSRGSRPSSGSRARPDRPSRTARSPSASTRRARPPCRSAPQRVPTLWRYVTPGHAVPAAEVADPARTARRGRG